MLYRRDVNKELTCVLPLSVPAHVSVVPLSPVRFLFALTSVSQSPPVCVFLALVYITSRKNVF